MINKETYVSNNEVSNNEVSNKAQYIGYITKIHFQKDGFMIASFMTEDKQTIRIKGIIYGVEKKEKISINGSWETHAKYGKQLAVSSWERPIPTTKEQVVAYLSSPLVKNCGKKYAIKIAETLGEHAIELINEHGADVLLSVKGMGIKRANQIAVSVRSTFEIQKIVDELKNYGVSTNTALKAYKQFGQNTISALKENPYQLIDLDGISFPKADEIAKRMGVMPLSSYRIDACLTHVLNKLCYEQGHCYIYENELINEVLLALNSNVQNKCDIVTLNELQQSIYRLEEHKIIIEDHRVYPKRLYNAEDDFAKKISYILNSKRKKKEIPTANIDNLINAYQRSNSILLTEKQREAIRLLFRENVLILTGGPGTGKTTVIRGMIDVFRKIYPKDKIGLAAPTGRASRKLSEVTGLEAFTIHRMIGYRQGEEPMYFHGNKLKYKLIIVDEMSMTDIHLASLLIDAIENDSTVLFVGDVDQLPSVGPGNVLADLINAGLPTVRLTEIFRQAKESQIVTNAHRINNGQPIIVDNTKNDFYFIQNSHLESIAELTVLSVTRFLKLGYDISDILVLSPIKKGIVGTEGLNEKIRSRVNPPSSDKAEVTLSKRVFREGDKVIQLVNNDDKNISNGDIGVIQFIDEENKSLIVNYSGMKVSYSKDELNQIDLAYCITVHKSQGGESPIVIIPIAFSQGRLLARNLIYTGLTRAKNIMVFIGQIEAMNYAIANNKITKRNSLLAERIRNYVQYNSQFKEKQIN